MCILLCSRSASLNEEDLNRKGDKTIMMMMMTMMMMRRRRRTRRRRRITVWFEHG
jgi:hypothetical protein